MVDPKNLASRIKRAKAPIHGQAARLGFEPVARSCMFGLKKWGLIKTRSSSREVRIRVTMEPPQKEDDFQHMGKN